MDALNHISAGKLATLALVPIVKAARRSYIRIALANTNYELSHIAATRENDRKAEQLIHTKQALLKSELAALEAP